MLAAAQLIGQRLVTERRIVVGGQRREVSVDLVVKEALGCVERKGKQAHQVPTELLECSVVLGENRPVLRDRIGPDVRDVEKGGFGVPAKLRGPIIRGTDIELLTEIGGIVVPKRLRQILLELYLKLLR